MNTNVRAILFGAVVAAAMLVTIDSVVAAEQPEIIRLDGVTVTADRANFDADGNIKAVQLEGVTVTGRK